MTQYIVEREIPGIGKMNEEERREAVRRSLGVLEGLGPDITWIHSFVTDDKIYCIYMTPDESLIREHGKRLGVPVDRVAAVRCLLEPALAD